MCVCADDSVGAESVALHLQLPRAGRRQIAWREARQGSWACRPRYGGGVDHVMHDVELGIDAAAVGV